MNSFSGMLHSVIGTQPLLVLRPTGPITLLLEKLHETNLGGFDRFTASVVNRKAFVFQPFRVVTMQHADQESR